MGLLDDAIREHLDLKRRRGADPAEVKRQEQEALGPVRRNREAPDEAYDDDLAADPGGGSEVMGAAPATLTEPGARADVFDESPEQAEPAGGHPHVDFDSETAEYDVHDPAGPADKESGDDMLEGTPDFLQDTPEHDRLWFEQRPPRDFDFDN